jgi:predicted homoserine dehydrogenase-like protein
MIIIDTALRKREEDNNPIKVGMIGAGFIGKGIALQIVNYVLGMKLVAIANRHVDAAIRAYKEAGIDDIREIHSTDELQDNIRAGKCSVTDNAEALCDAEAIDVIIEATGAVEYASGLVLRAIRNRKHVVIMGAEVDGTVGPILKVHADKAGVVLTATDGDQPGVEGNLFRFVKSIGIKPVLCGNIKGLHDPYRNPTTQESYAKQWGQNPSMVTSFADGTKISFEQATVANATGMGVGIRGMFGPTVNPGTHLSAIVQDLYPLDVLLQGSGIVDYIVGADPAPGVFIFGTHDHPRQQHFLNLYKLGEGPLYLFYTPYHLCHFETPLTVARAVLFHDAALKPLGAPRVDVVTAAKTDLKAGNILDGIGYYMTYGLCENYETAKQDRLLPMGISEGCVLKRDIPKDACITYDDVELPVNRMCDRLRQEQETYFSAPANGVGVC